MFFFSFLHMGEQVFLVAHGEFSQKLFGFVSDVNIFVAGNISSTEISLFI